MLLSSALKECSWASWGGLEGLLHLHLHLYLYLYLLLYLYLYESGEEVDHIQCTGTADSDSPYLYLSLYPVFISAAEQNPCTGRCETRKMLHNGKQSIEFRIIEFRSSFFLVQIWISGFRHC